MLIELGITAVVFGVAGYYTGAHSKTVRVQALAVLIDVAKKAKEEGTSLGEAVLVKVKALVEKV